MMRIMMVITIIMRILGSLLLLVHSMVLLGVTLSSFNNETLVHEHSHELNKPEYQGDLRNYPAAVYVGRNVDDYESFDDGAVLIQRAEPKDQCKK